MRQPVWVVQERNIVTKAHLTSITKPRKPEINVLKFSILPIIFSMTTLTWPTSTQHVMVGITRSKVIFLRPITPSITIGSGALYYRGYNSNYSCIKPFKRVVRPLTTGRVPPSSNIALPGTYIPRSNIAPRPTSPPANVVARFPLPWDCHPRRQRPHVLFGIFHPWVFVVPQGFVLL